MEWLKGIATAFGIIFIVTVAMVILSATIGP